MSAWIVDLVLILLGVLSIGTWSIIVWKIKLKSKLKKDDQKFLKEFWGASDLRAAEKIAANDQGDYAELARTGFDELKDFKNQVATLKVKEGIRPVLERQFRQQLQNIARNNEKGLTELATVGSASPFIGLFGTVWGIKNALTEIGKAGQAGLDVVAGPIGEALIATAIGIAVALPAVLAYNYFLRQLNLRTTELENFCEDFVRLAEKQD